MPRLGGGRSSHAGVWVSEVEVGFGYRDPLHTHLDCLMGLGFRVDQILLEQIFQKMKTDSSHLRLL